MDGVPFVLFINNVLHLSMHTDVSVKKFNNIPRHRMINYQLTWWLKIFLFQLWYQSIHLTFRYSFFLLKFLSHSCRHLFFNYDNDYYILQRIPLTIIIIDFILWRKILWKSCLPNYEFQTVFFSTQIDLIIIIIGILLFGRSFCQNYGYHHYDE